ncbi:MAG TPA: ATP-dependent DNA helicase [Candidatus Dormibacteraeota bacterium]|jgi:DNA helicase-2/ATP-dependent DNA helicase PcrA|nr:ATP-dependent DNA helicase [Candidatus Dormibacteraeota bacterium]
MPTVPLDPDQRAAVDHREGPCLVLAGPGSGKTRVIVERFLALVGEGLPPERQLVLTYTVKAAAEMRDRAEREHGAFNGDVPLTNFHSFARRVVREWGWLVGIPPTFRVPDEAEQWLHLDAVLSELRPRTLWNPLRPHDMIHDLLRLFGAAKQELVTPDAYAGWAARALLQSTDAAERSLLQRQDECARVYARLQDRYRRHAVLDHDDCILVCETLLREHAAVHRAVAEPLGQVMVDEYQDTNYAQARLVETLVASHQNVLVVADDDQAIYKFRGASLANLNRFRRVYPEHRTVVLRRNYRSTRQVVTTCRAVIATAAEHSRIAKDLEAARGDGMGVELWEAPDERSEMLAVAGECRRLLESGEVSRAADIALLFRQHGDMRSAMAAMQEVGVPYQVHGGRGYFQQPEIKDLLALLSLVNDPRDSQAMLRCLRLPAWRVSGVGRRALVELCEANDVPLFNLVADGALGTLTDDDAGAAVRCVAALTDLNGLVTHDDARSIFHRAMEVAEYHRAVLELEKPIERMQAGANVNKFDELLERFTEWTQDHRLSQALQYLQILRDSGAADEVAPIEPSEDGVLLLTCHAAKGLEWPVVVVPRCVESRWPGRSGFGSRLTLPNELVPEEAPPGDGSVDEERRLFYVAATRARDRLVFTRAGRYPRSFSDERLTPFLAAITNVEAQPVARPVEYAWQPMRRRGRAAGTAEPGKRAWSVSSLRDFKACPRRFQYREVYQMPTRSSVHGWYGEMMHRTLQLAGKRRLAGAEVDAAALCEIWNDVYENTPGPKGAHPELRQYGEEQLRHYAQTPAWIDAGITAVEDKFVLSLDTAASLTGRFDRLDDGVPPTVVDYKTGPPRDEAALRSDLQVRAYAVALARRAEVDSVAVELHHLQTGESTRMVFGAKDLQRFTNHLSVSTAELARAWREGDFPPRPSAWQCRRCDYRTVCDEGREAAARGEA